MSEDFPRGRFIWHELLTNDVEAATAFYAGIAGWGTTVWEHEGMKYDMFTLGEMPCAGAWKLTDELITAGVPPHWVPYVAVPDVDATAARARELGGEVRMEPHSIPMVGRIAVIVDPQGAQIGLYRPEGEVGGHDGPPRLGEVSWHELATTDLDGAWAFYSDLFGWQETSTMDMGEAGPYKMYGRVGLPLGGIYNKPPAMPGPSAWLGYVRVPDVNQSIEKIKAAGGQVINGPMEVPGGDWIAQCLDPQGGMFAVHHTGSGQQG